MTVKPLNVLTTTTLFPNAARPSHGIFVETRLRHLVASGDIQLRVVAPVPWVPAPLTKTKRYADLAAAPAREWRFGVPVEHPRYAVIPRFGMSLAPLTLYHAFREGVRQLGIDTDQIDLIDAHYFYPDGVAAALLARELGRPLVITARGTDLNLIPSYALPRGMIRWAARQATGLITVCTALKEALIGLGVPEEKVRVLRNGVDLERFRPLDRVTARANLGLSKPTLLSVGHLIERKGHHLVIEALVMLPEFELLVVGDGEERGRLEALAQAAGSSGRVRFIGAVPQSALAELYSAADALVLASSREGWANVLLESLACGTPVVATAIWGTPEVIADPLAGVLIPERTPQAIAEGVRRLMARYPDRAATKAYAEQFSWDATTAGQIDLFRSLTAAKAGGHTAANAGAACPPRPSST